MIFKPVHLFKALASASSAIALTMGGTAAAQVSNTATADVRASLQSVTPPLAVEATQALEFGTVNIPNGTRAGNVCRYDVSGSPNLNRKVTETDPAFNTVGTTGPTPSNCDFSGSFSPARFTIACDPSTSTNMEASYTDLTNGNDVTFGRPDTSGGFDTLSVFQKDRDDQFIASTGRPNIDITCPDGSQTGATAGAFDVYVGGRIILRENAIPGGDLLLGNITLTATY